jgi:hypothetical protein
MKTIREITPTEQRVYTMPDEIYAVISTWLAFKFFRSVSKAVASLPEKVRQLVTVEVSPHEPTLRGKTADIRIDAEPFTSAHDLAMTIQAEEKPPIT